MMKHCFTTLTLLFCVVWAQAQQLTVTGTVKDKDGVPLAGVTVFEKAVAANQVQTKEDGQYSITVDGQKSILVFSYVGFEPAEHAVGTRTRVDVSLSEDVSSLDEVVIVGYQRQSRKKSTSAIQVIGGEEIENLPAPSFESLLQGRVSGVNIQNFTGAPGARNTFTVRGNTTISQDLGSEIDLANTLSSPLFIIDGMPVSTNDLAGSMATGTNYIAGINVNDIATIVVQKDAAATAVWGSRGANGVIVINTKKGRLGKPSVRIGYYAGMTQTPELQRTIAGAQERRQKMGLMKEYGTHDQLANIPQVLTDSLNPSFNNATDWQELFYNTGMLQNMDVNFSGGTEQLNYRLGLNYYDEDGIVRNTGFTRYSLRGNFNFNLFPIARTNLIVAASRMNRKRGLGRTPIDNITPINAATLPASFIRLEDADYEFYYGQYDQLKDDNITDALSVFSQTDIDILKNLTYSFQGSMQGTLDRRDRFMPTTIASGGQSFAASEKNDNYVYNIANIINYTQTVANEHTFILTGMQSLDYTQHKKSYLIGYNVPTDDIEVVTGIAQRDLSGYSDIREAGLLSFMGQFAYDYKSKYIINASWRADASSRFGTNTKWGYFPAVSFAWNISDEAFLQSVPWVSLLKFRASWGESGTLPRDFYAPFNVWDLPSTTYRGNTIAVPSFYQPLTLTNLTWNKSAQTNIGTDFSLFGGRFNGMIDVYRKETKDPIMSFDFPFYTGYTSLSYNVPMTILNEGVDVQLTSNNLKASSALQWSTTLNLSYNKNRLGSLPNGDRSFYQGARGGQQLLFSVGSPIYQWAQMIYQGVYTHANEIPVNPVTGSRLTYFKGNYAVQPGFPDWQDINGDWDVWSDEDRGAADGDLTPTGDPNPRFTGGLYNEFNWKGISVGILGVFTFKRDIINTFMADQYNGVWNFGGINNFANQRLPDYSKENYWTPSKAEDPNYQADFPSLSPYGPNYYQFLPFSTLWNENGNYFKIKTVTLGYSFSSQLLQRAGIGLQGARLYAIMDNILTFQSASVPDAELITPQGEYDGGAYPLPRKFTFGVEITF
ncbi:SusC/RagA family TonB-linked outer membrane protein [Parapedobacter sp. 2B3]|uniref:SusC/RagA family TonB-linked outer membrane protein n=1 Tax=Parapedobacter sp. 2B3 TaxID=3342381 RepID=UPI0035B69485